MELADVVNAHFAFPVVGVVVCAVLVFAFGFKSPVEPPSFDALDDDEKKTKKTRQRKQTHSDKVRYDFWDCITESPSSSCFLCLRLQNVANFCYHLLLGSDRHPVYSGRCPGYGYDSISRLGVIFRLTMHTSRGWGIEVWQHIFPSVQMEDNINKFSVKFLMHMFSLRKLKSICIRRPLP